VIGTPTVPGIDRGHTAAQSFERQLSRGESAREVVDPRDGKSYGTVTIAGLTWMTRNLEFATADSACPRNEPAACAAEGRLYPWESAITACPAGWHLATESDWQRLERAVGVPENELDIERERGKGTALALLPGGATGLDFPLPGWRRPNGEFRVGNGNDRAAAIWTATKANDTQAWHRDLSSARTGIWRSPVTFDYSLSVRCVAD
jgi:uncharacterized protein (TIGR02145 family)